MCQGIVNGTPAVKDVMAKGCQDEQIISTHLIHMKKGTHHETISKTNNLVQYIGLLLILAFISTGAIMPSSIIAPNVQPAVSNYLAAQRWETYSDQRFGFQIEYPQGWYISPRDDSESKIGTTLSFSNLPFSEGVEQESTVNSRVVVTIGFYLAEIQSEQSIDQWASVYEKRAQIEDPAKITMTENLSTPISSRIGWRLGGTAALGTFHVVMVPVENIVWFIWSDAEGIDLGIYNHMVASFDIGNRPPKSLKDVYGEDFKPVSLVASNKLTNESSAILHNPRLAASGHLAAPML